MVKSSDFSHRMLYSGNFLHFWQIEVILRRLKCKQLFVLPYFFLKRAFGKFTPSRVATSPLLLFQTRVNYYVSWSETCKGIWTSICVVRNLRKAEEQPTTTIFASADMSPRCLRCWAQNLRFETFNCRFANLFGVLNGEQEEEVSANYKTQGLLCVIGTVAKADNFFDIKTWLKKSCGVWLLHQYFPRMKIFWIEDWLIYNKSSMVKLCTYSVGTKKQTDFVCDLWQATFKLFTIWCEL